jgi:DNA repair exonuclease SbcCD ATPase subunit
LATKSKKRHDEESKKNIATFKELRKELKEQFGQVATLEDQVEELKQELADEKGRSQSAQAQAVEAQDQKRELQEMLRAVREEASILKSSAAQASTRESGMAARISELEAQLANRPEAQMTSEATAVQSSDDGNWEESYRKQEEEMQREMEQWERERGERIAQIDTLTAQFAQVSEELAQLKTALTEGEERARLAAERTNAAEQALTTATAEWTKRLAVSEEKLREIESQAAHRGREERTLHRHPRRNILADVNSDCGVCAVRGDLDRLQAENASLIAQLKQMEQEVQLHKAEAETLQQLSLLKTSPALAAHTGIQTRRNLEPEMIAAAREATYSGRQPTAVSATAAAKDYNMRKVRRHSEADKEQDITDLLQSDDVVHTRPRTMPAKASADIMHDESEPAVDYNSDRTGTDLRTDPVEYLSEELVHVLFPSVVQTRVPHTILLRLCIYSRACP